MAAEVEFISAIVVIGRPVRFDASTLPVALITTLRQLLLVVLREKEANKKSAAIVLWRNRMYRHPAYSEIRPCFLGCLNAPCEVKFQELYHFRKQHKQNRSWKYEVLGPGNFIVPVFFLDAGLPVPFHSPGQKENHFLPNS